MAARYETRMTQRRAQTKNETRHVFNEPPPHLAGRTVKAQQAVTRNRAVAVRDILAYHPKKVIWSQKALARTLAAKLPNGNPRAYGRMLHWIRHTGRRHLADCLLRDPVSGYVQGLADPARLAACLPKEGVAGK